MTWSVSQRRVSRGLVLAVAVAALGLATPAPATIVAAPAQATPGEPQERPRPNAQRYVVYTRPYLKIVTDRALRNAIRLNKAGGEVVTDGFGQEMSVHLFRMLLLLRQRTVNLLDSLETKRTREARLTNLSYEADIVGRALATLKGEDGADVGEVFYPLERETEDKAIAIKRLTAYEALIYRWMNTPMEGTYRTPGAPGN